MYKKITHTIVEEHFDHPVGVEIADASNSGGEIPLMFRHLRPRAADVMSADIFKSNILNAFLDMDAAMRDLVESELDGDPSNNDVMLQNAMTTAAIPGQLLRPYYGYEFDSRTTLLFQGASSTMMYIWRNLFAGRDIAQAVNRQYEINFPNYAVLLNSYNNQWGIDQVKNLLDAWYGNWVEWARAKKRNDAVAAATAESQNLTYVNQIANTVSSGVIAQKPELFTA